MERHYYKRTGFPFAGATLQKLITFLNEQELDYDDQITFTVVLEDDDRIIATGSCHANIIKCVAVSPDYQGQNLMSEIMTELVAHLFEQGITHYFGFTKPKNKAIFGSMGLYPVAETENILLLENRKDGLKKYIQKLQQETKAAKGSGAENACGTGIGAIVANCNPFTLGHRYLIEQASKACRWVHLFILSEDQGWITASDRYEMVKLGIADFSNVILHRTSDYLISPVVFPTYFIKEKQQAFSMNCMLDIHIFTKYIAGALQIDRRFVGTEQSCQVTRAYNQCLKQELPKAGIEVVELQRLEAEGCAISASVVRKEWQSGHPENTKVYLPETTYHWLEEKFSDHL
ncbi:MAG: [citrate (pro-3S)-lyase] ligase [Coprococcus sp.]